jgi:hypothetical protein
MSPIEYIITATTAIQDYIIYEGKMDRPKIPNGRAIWSGEE